MRGELPVCKRCCFCLPLRYGLITWGYFRLIMSIIFITGVSILFYGVLEMFFYYPSVPFTIYTVFLGFIIIVTLTDIALNIVFIIGGHKKNPQLLRVYYVYSFVLWILTSLLGFASTVHTLFQYKYGNIDVSLHIWIILIEVACFFAQIIMQAYVLLLVRSEVIKLRSNCQFRFVNNAGDSECTMRCDEEIAGGKKGTEDIYERSTYMPKDTCEFIGYVTRNDELN